MSDQMRSVDRDVFGWPLPSPEQKKLDPEFKAQWLKALRSGEYQQVAGVLRGDLAGSAVHIGHCCLGVAAEVAGVERIDCEYNFGGPDDPDTDPDPGDINELPPPNWETNAPPEGWMGLTKDTIDVLTSANDGEGWTNRDLSYDESVVYKKTFSEIADWIERHL